ncbi:MAG: hypothetical protein HC825_04380 [Oscillatoriales cyanobacterium RM1_1_9]|nr:hypothetical protein [Oscillatoriales cyanobacterium SM2_3_0]NJO46568.1 hypothetical protein [Oscillatoriales cyanobacterium RM2_1_1]NJO71136.1 hypothetical protein [Oscillatoriales cyanobacterium RM1_1_9]
MSTDDLQIMTDRRYSKIGLLLTQLIETEWRRLLRELDALAPHPGDRERAARLVGQYQVLDKLMAALSEGSLGSDYKIEAQWRNKLLERILESFDLDICIPQPPPQYRSLAQQVAEACGLEVLEQ